MGITVALITSAVVFFILVTVIFSRNAFSIYQAKQSWRTSGRKVSTGESGVRIGKITGTLVEAPYKIFTSDFDVEIPSSQLAKEVHVFKQNWKDQKQKLRRLVTAISKSKNEFLNVPKAGRSLTFLVDHSASMPIDIVQNIAVAIDQSARKLEEAKIPFEILGFTTRSFSGGFSRRKWQQAGEPSYPGRVADLLYITYKAFDQPYDTVSGDLAIMLESEIRRENLDGEALLWAHSRFEKTRFHRWACIVMGDGRPADNSTIGNNYSTMLDEHLSATLEALGKKQNTRIFGFGAGKDIGQWYPSAVFARAGTSFIEQLNSQIIRALRD